MAETGARDRRDIPPQALRGPARENFDLEYREPSPALEDIVDYHWIVAWSVPAGEEVVQPVVTHPSIHLTVEGDRATVTGVVTRRFRRGLVGSGRVVGVRFRPSGFAALSPAPASGLTDEALPASEVLGAETAGELAGVGAGDPTVDVDEAVQRMEAVLRGRRRPRPPGAELVDEAVDHIVAQPEVMRVEQVARHFGVSSRTLQRRFERFLGVGPEVGHPAAPHPRGARGDRGRSRHGLERVGPPARLRRPGPLRPRVHGAGRPAAVVLRGALVDPRGSHRGVSPARSAAGHRPRRRRSRWLRLPPASSPATNLTRRYIHGTSASAH